MKICKASILLFLLLLLLCFSNCYYYKTIEHSSINSEEIDTMQKTKTSVFMENNYSSALYRVDSLVISDSTFSGYLSFTLSAHEKDKSSFKRKKKKEAKYNFDPLNSIHIVLRSDSMINEGYFELPLSEIKSVDSHVKDKGLSTSMTVVATLVGVGAVVGLGLLFWSLAWSGAL